MIGVKYLNPGSYKRRLSTFVNESVLARIEHLIGLGGEAPLRHPPVFICGAPRSGSTLMIQVIADALNIGFLSNRHAQWYGAPALAEKLFRPLDSRPVSNYKSAYGVTNGSHAPAECGEWWYRFFQRTPAHVTLQDLHPPKMAAFRNSISSFTNAVDMPVLYKNLYASLRIRAIAEYIPESLFIVTHRNEVDNAHSLLEARYQTFGSYDPWFSVEPAAISELKNLPPHQQVVEQIRHIHEKIEQDLNEANVSGARRFNLIYEDFCKDPSISLKKLQAFFSANNCQITRRDTTIPDSFNVRHQIRIDPTLYDEMVRYSRNGKK